MYSLADIDLLFDVAGWFTGGLTPPDPGVSTSPPIPPPPTTPTTTPPPASTTPPTTAPAGPPPGPAPSSAVNCSDFPNWAAANAWFQYYFPIYGDIAGLDANHDGVPCESLPGAP
jgi:Excalibur calcium-binding domain